jgi:hypothetical protein
MSQNKTQIPQSGDFYWHMKHDSNDFFSYLYIIIGVSLDTEADNLEVVYAPLYETKHQLFNRDLELFIGSKKENGVEVPRFTKVTNQEDIAKIYDSGSITKWTNLFNR